MKASRIWARLETPVISERFVGREKSDSNEGSDHPSDLDEDDVKAEHSKDDISNHKQKKDSLVDINKNESTLGESELADAMGETAKMVVNTCMEIRRHENVLIVCDPSTSEIGKALHAAAAEITDRILLVVMPKARHHGEEPPRPVVNLMRQQQVVMAPTRYSITHTKARMQANRDGARIATMPGITVDMFTKGGMKVDFNEVREYITDISSILRRKRNVRLTSAQGTEITFEVDFRRWNKEDSGICNRPGMITNLPAGKVFVMPKEGTMNGTLIIDGSWDADLLDEPIELKVEDGLVVDVKGGIEAAQIRSAFGEVAAKLKPKEQESVWTVAEFGFGMNPAARLSGNVLEDEKKLGTCYFAIGDNSALGGSVNVGIRFTGVLAEPSLWINDTQVLESGAFLL